MRCSGANPCVLPFCNRYFQRRFPRLFLTCYAFALARLTGEPAMAAYFPADARQLMAPFFSDERAPQVCHTSGLYKSSSCFSDECARQVTSPGETSCRHAIAAPFRWGFHATLPLPSKGRVGWCPPSVGRRVPWLPNWGPANSAQCCRPSTAEGSAIQRPVLLCCSSAWA